MGADFVFSWCVFSCFHGKALLHIRVFMGKKMHPESKKNNKTLCHFVKMT